MTCIVGIEHEGKVYVGGDSLGVGGLDCSHRKDRKVAVVGEFAIGFTSSYRMGQLLHYNFKPPSLKESQDIMKFMVVDFVDALRICFKDGGFARRVDEVEEGGFFIVGYRGELFMIQDDYQVARFSDGYCSTGCGESYALGSLYATGKTRKSPESRINEALDAASHFSAGVGGPYTIVSV